MSKSCETCFWNSEEPCEADDMPLISVKVHNTVYSAVMPFFEETGGDDDCVHWHPRLNKKQLVKALEQFK